MAKIYNSDCITGLQKNAGIQQNVDKTPNELAEKIVPTFETNPKMLRVCEIVLGSLAQNATSATIYTTPTDRDFYLTAANISNIQDATATSTASSLKVYPKGQTSQQVLMTIGSLGGVNSGTIANQFVPPILLERGKTIDLTNTTANANVKVNGSIVGYIDYSSA